MGEQETFLIHVAVIDGHEVGQAVGGEFFAEGSDARLVVLEAVDVACAVG